MLSLYTWDLFINTAKKKYLVHLLASLAFDPT